MGDSRKFNRGQEKSMKYFNSKICSPRGKVNDYLAEIKVAERCVFGFGRLGR